MKSNTPMQDFPISDDETVREQQFRRAVSSFEGIILSQIEMKNKLGDRLNYSIVVGIGILGIIAISILILLLTLSSQINRMSSVVDAMNVNFTNVADQMTAIDGYVTSMEKQVALLNGINDQTTLMVSEMEIISLDMSNVLTRVDGISRHVSSVRRNVGNISNSIDRVDFEVVNMSRDMHKISKPSRSFNKMFPFFD